MSNYKTIGGVLHAQRNGQWLPVGDAVGFEQSANPESHKKFFGTPDDRQLLRRKQALEHLVNQTMNEAVPPNITRQTVSDETYRNMLAATREERQAEGITLLPEYIQKISKIRAPYPGEVGVCERGSEVIYLFLEEGYEKGHIITNNPLVKEKGGESAEEPKVVLTGVE